MVIPREEQGLREEESKSVRPIMVEVVDSMVEILDLQQGKRGQVCSLTGLPRTIDHQLSKAGLKSGMEAEQELSRTRDMKGPLRETRNRGPRKLRAHWRMIPRSIATVSGQQCLNRLRQLEAWISQCMRHRTPRMMLKARHTNVLWKTVNAFIG